MAEAQASLKRFYLLIGALVLIGGGALWWMSRGSAVPPMPTPVEARPSDTSAFAGYMLGSETAPVTIVEFGDYTCPVCARFEVQFPDVRRRLIETGRVRFVYMDFPLGHESSRSAAHAAACADEQGRFWEYREALYQTQMSWLSARNPGSRFRQTAASVGLEIGAYDQCMRSQRFAERISSMAAQGARLGVGATPTFLIGDRLYPGFLAYDQIKGIVDSISSTKQGQP